MFRSIRHIPAHTKRIQPQPPRVHILRLLVQLTGQRLLEHRRIEHGVRSGRTHGRSRIARQALGALAFPARPFGRPSSIRNLPRTTTQLLPRIAGHHVLRDLNTQPRRILRETTFLTMLVHPPQITPERRTRLLRGHDPLESIPERRPNRLHVEIVQITTARSQRTNTLTSRGRRIRLATEQPPRLLGHPSRNTLQPLRHQLHPRIRRQGPMEQIQRRLPRRRTLLNRKLVDRARRTRQVQVAAAVGQFPVQRQHGTAHR
ncbi:MAG: hypothetical protein IJH84_11915, partial [Saccharopolyspora sp.]|uniref:hypothetical protein n=1 Tax=Saccharopolyspora sp. TaxID=33915 RepID=UPI0025D4263C